MEREASDMSKLEKVYQFMGRSSFNRRLVGTLIGILLIGGFYIIGTGVTHSVQDTIARNERAADIQRVKDASPEEYVNFYSVKVDDTPIGDDPNLTLCRKLGHGTVKVDAVRTFIRYESGREVQVETRPFEASIEESITNTDCTTVPLRGQPQVVGEYSIFTDYCFNVEVHQEIIKKCDNYSSNKYKITDDVQQLKQRIEDLQQEYDRRLSNSQSAAASQSESIAQSTPPESANQGAQSSPQQNTAGGSTGGNDQGVTTTPPPRNTGLTIDLPLLPPIKLFGE